MNNNEYYLKRTRAAAKEIELNVPQENRSKKDVNIEDIFPFIISVVGDISYQINKENKELNEEETNKLAFASKYLTSYIQINPNVVIQNKYLAIGAVAAYLCDRVGDAVLLASSIKEESIHSALFYTLVRILKNTIAKPDFYSTNQFYKNELKAFIHEYDSAINDGRLLKHEISEQLRVKVYSLGSDNELLLVDLLLALCRVKCRYSIAAMLKLNENIPEEKKTLLINSKAIIREFWPAQRLILTNKILDGKSGVIQLPTGAGKTKSISLCVFSYLSSHDVGISVIVSPFRALCRETARTLKQDLKFDKSISVIELSDVMKHDYDLPGTEKVANKASVVVTPEKLLYVLRHNPEFTQNIGQLIFDEGHIFSDDKRGANYELLVASILEMIKTKPQIIMISAIVSGVNEINNWLSEGQGSVISETCIATTDKYTAALAINKYEGRSFLYLDYLNSTNLDETEFYVPRFIEQIKYEDKGKTLSFPNDNKDSSIATLIRLSKYANCAVFAGRKKIVNSLAKRIVELNKFMDMRILSERNNANEQKRILDLISKNYGEESIYYKIGRLGVFLHHAGISDGIKASVEYALSQNFITNVICTSTLSQGVNLPIKYLIIHSIYPEKNPITKQDYKNLIGRVGRSGMYTEGTIIYSDSKSYFLKDKKWKAFAKLYKKSSDSCVSQLLWLCGSLNNIDLSDLIKQYYTENKTNVDSIINMLPGNIEEKGDTWDHIKNVLGNMESFLAQWPEINDERIDSLVEHTLLKQSTNTYYSDRLKETIKTINSYLQMRIPDVTRRLSYSKSLLSIEDYVSLCEFISELDQADELSVSSIQEKCLEQVYKLSSNQTIKKVNIDLIKHIASLWINGVSYVDIYNQCKTARVLYGSKTRAILLEDISSICDNGFNYSATIILNAICELIEKKEDNLKDTAAIVYDYMSQLKYGLPDRSSICVYEWFFNDRFLAQKISRMIVGSINTKEEAMILLQAHKEEISEYLQSYPSYFTERLNSLLIP